MSASTRHQSSGRGSRGQIVTPRQLAITGIGSLLTFAWYASPDLFTEKKPRALVRLCIIPALTALTALVARDTVTAVRDDIASESPDQEAWEMTSDNVKFDPKNLDWRVLMLLGAFGTVLLGCSIWLEFWLFRRGERRRLSGVKLAHTRQAIPISLLFAAGYLVDDAQTN